MLKKSCGYLFGALLFLFASYASSQSRSPSTAFIEAIQVASVSTGAEADKITKSWAEKVRQGLDSMVSQELGVTKEIQLGVDKLSKSCELSSALKRNSPKIDVSALSNHERQIDLRVQLRQQDRTALLASIDSLKQKSSQAMSENCGFLGVLSKDAIACSLAKYKNEMAGSLQDSVNKFYDSIFKRYSLYKVVITQAKNGCTQPEFMGKLMQADSDYLVSYEDRANNTFTRLVEAIGSAFLNQSNTN
ncbi:hypothetical protein G6734_07520 [Polynucleobacter paneuropaeus]|nr:hypothetical protein [Polynucleobacter paneuropaeus]